MAKAFSRIDALLTKPGTRLVTLLGVLVTFHPGCVEHVLEHYRFIDHSATFTLPIKNETAESLQIGESDDRIVLSPGQTGHIAFRWTRSSRLRKAVDHQLERAPGSTITRLDREFATPQGAFGFNPRDLTMPAVVLNVENTGTWWLSLSTSEVWFQVPYDLEMETFTVDQEPDWRIISIHPPATCEHSATDSAPPPGTSPDGHRR